MKFTKKLRLHPRYGRFQIYLMISFAVFLAFFLGEIFFFGSDGGKLVGRDTGIAELLVPLFTCESLFLLLSFFLGITVYAPAFGMIASAARGVLSGFAVSALLPPQGIRGYVLFFLCLFYLLVSSWLQAGYFSFCAMVSMRLFTDGILKTGKEEEGRMFGGTLFNSRLFCNTVNFRFLFTYCLVFFSFYCLALFLVFLYVLLRSLVFG